MKNKIVGFIILGIVILIGFIIFSFNRALKQIVGMSCVHGATCPMWSSISFQTNMSLIILGFVVVIALYFIFFGKEKEILVQSNDINHKKVLKALNKDEKFIFNKVREADGNILQADLVKSTGYSKVKITRILDSLEGKNLIERRRRGMTNVVLLKYQK